MREPVNGWSNIEVERRKELEEENEKLREDRDLWKISEETCNQNYNELLGENEKLRAVNKQMMTALKEVADYIKDQQNCGFDAEHWEDDVVAAIKAGEEKKT